MKRYSNLGIETIVTNDKIKIEVKISGAINAFNNNPTNYCPNITVKRGKRKEFAEYLAKSLIEVGNSETGDSLVMEMFDQIFEQIFESAEDFCNYPDEE